MISGVADAVPDRIAALVYLDAFLLEEGEGLHDLLPDEQRELQLSLADEHGEGWRVPPIPAEIFNVNARDRDWVDRQCTPQPLATFQQKLRLSRRPSASRAQPFHLCVGLGGDAVHRLLSAREGARLDDERDRCGHDVMLDDPEALVAELLGVAGAARRGEPDPDRAPLRPA